MGFRFRKTVKLGGININMSKSGIGASIGAKGARFTRTATGRNRSTLSVPGTGLSYVSESSAYHSKNKSKKGEEMKMPYSSSVSNEQNPSPKPPAGKIKKILQWILTAFLALFVLGTMPSFASFLFLAATVFVMPIDAIQKAIRRILKPSVKTIVIVVMIVLGFFTAPGTEDAQTVGDRSLPSENEQIISPVETKTSDTTESLPLLENTVAETTTPETTVPETTSPAMTVPETTVSETTVPETTVPNTTVPETTVPNTTVPETTPPKTNTPESNVPPKNNVSETTVPVTTDPSAEERNYVLNTSTKRIHKPGCSSVSDIEDTNRKDYYGIFSDLLAQGYVGCKRCNPF